MYVLCCGEGGLLCCVFAEVVWGISFMWGWGPNEVWVVLVGVILCGFVVYVCGVVDFGMGGCVVLLPGCGGGGGAPPRGAPGPGVTVAGCRARSH